MCCAASKTCAVKAAKSAFSTRSEPLENAKKEGNSATVPVSLQGTKIKSLPPFAAWVASESAKVPSGTTATCPETNTSLAVLFAVEVPNALTMGS